MCQFLGIFEIVNCFKDQLLLKNFIKSHPRNNVISLSKVDVGGGARVQYCKLVCQQGAWKGPYCSHDPSHDITFTPGRAANGGDKKLNDGLDGVKYKCKKVKYYVNV